MCHQVARFCTRRRNLPSRRTSYHWPAASPCHDLLGVFAAAIGSALGGPVADRSRKLGTFPRTSTRRRGLCHQRHNCPFGSTSALPSNRLHWTEGLPRRASVPSRPSSRRRIAAILPRDSKQDGPRNK